MENVVKMSKSMETITEALHDGETIVCVEKIKEFKLFEEPFTKQIAISTLIKVVCWAFCFVFFIDSLSQKGALLATDYAILIIMALVAVVMLIYPAFDRRQLLKSGTFAITNHRVINYAGENLLKSLLLEDVTRVKAVPLENGAHILMINAACDKPVEKSRKYAFTGTVDKEERLNGLVLYSIENPQKFCKYFPNLKEAEGLNLNNKIGALDSAA